MDKLITEVTALTVEEALAASKKYPMFHSAHEASAVLKEEIDETTDEIMRLQQSYNNLWKAIRSDSCTQDMFMELRNIAILVAAEAIQAAAVCFNSSNSSIFEEDN